MDRALQNHNNIMIAKMMVKYGTGEDKLNALAVLRDLFNKEKENMVETASPMETIDIEFNTDIPTSTPTSRELGPVDELGPDT